MDTPTLIDVANRGINSRLTERRLRRGTQSLASLRNELGVVEEQVQHFAEEVHDLEIRALVSETPLADAESRDAIAELELRQDDLLDRLGR